MLLTEEQRRAWRADAEQAGTLVWVPGRCSEEEVASLVRFARRVLGGQACNDERFCEQLMTHLHLCGYQLLLAKYAVLHAHRALEAHAAERLEGFHALGYDNRELMLRLLAHVHAAPYLRTDCAPGAGPLLPGSAAPLADGALELGALRALGEAEMRTALEEYEQQRAERLLPGVRRWEASLDAAVASEGFDLQKLTELVAEGASAHGVLLADLAQPTESGEALTGTLQRLHSQWTEATAWHERCARIVGGAQSAPMLEALLAEAEGFATALPLCEVGELRKRLERARAWLEATRAAARRPLKLRELSELHSEAEVLRQAGREAEELAARYLRSKRWMSQANEILRRTSSRGRAGAPKLSMADAQGLLAEAEELRLEQVEIEQLHEKLDEAKVWMQDAAVLLASGQSVGEQAMAHLLELHARAENIPILLDSHASLEERLSRLQSWQARAKGALDGRNPQSLDTEHVRELVAEAQELGISLGDLAQLSSQLAYHTWHEGAMRALNGVASLVRLEELVTQSAELGECTGLADHVAELRRKLAAGRAWRDKLREEGGGRAALKDAVSLLAEAEAEGVCMPESDALKKDVCEAKEWQEVARKNSSRSTRGGSSRPTLDELRELLSEGEALPLLVAECAPLAQQVHEAEEWRLRAEAAVALGDDEAKQAAALKELREVKRLGEAVVADVDVGRTVAVRLWRLQARTARARPKGALLKELQALLDEGERLQLHVPMQGDAPLAEAEAERRGEEGEETADKKPAPRKSGRAKKPPAKGSDDAAASDKPAEEEVVLRDGERERAERLQAAAEWRELRALVARALAWQEQAEAVLTTQKVRVDEMQRLLALGAELPVVMEEREWISVNLAEAQKWLHTAAELQAPSALLEDVQKLLKEYAKINVLSEAVDALRRRAAQGEEWLAHCNALYDKCGIELSSLRLILETDGAELYCTCRQPDDLQRLMIGCDHCPIWYHINCMGVSSAKAKALGEGADYMCPACCQKKGVKYAYTPRVLKAQPKRLPCVPRVVRLIARAEALSVRVEEALLLRKALLRCRRWQAGLVPQILRIFVQSTGAALCGSLRQEQLDEWLGRGEHYRVECELCVVLKGWRCMLQLRGHGGGGKLELAWLAALLEQARADGVSVERLDEILGRETDSRAAAIGAAAAAAAAEAAAAAAATAAATAAAALAAPDPEVKDEPPLADGSEPAAAGDAAAKEEPKEEKAGDDGEEECEGGCGGVEEVELDSQAGAWLRAELMALRAELVVLEQRMVEAREWEQQVGELTMGKAGSELVALQQLVLRGQQSPISLPSLRALLEHLERVASWTRECEVSMAPQGAPGVPGGSALRTSLEKLLRLEADGARLCMAGPRWQQLLNLLDACARAFDAMRKGLVHYAGGPAFAALFASFDALRVHCDEGELLRQQVRLLQSRHAGAAPVVAAMAVQPVPVPVGGAGADAGAGGAGAGSNPLLCDEAGPDAAVAAATAGSSSAPSPVPPAAVSQSGTRAPSPAEGIAERPEKPISTGLHGVLRKQAAGGRVIVYYEEDGVSVPYPGTVESVDAKRGIRAHLDGFQKREWVTDEDEWEWVEGSLESGVEPVEHIIGLGAFRQTLQRLQRLQQLCATAALGTHTPMAHTPAAKKPKAASGSKRGAPLGGTSAAPAKPAKQTRAQPAAKAVPSAPGSATGAAAASIVAAAAAAAAQAQSHAGQKRKAPMAAQKPLRPERAPVVQTGAAAPGMVMAPGAAIPGAPGGVVPPGATRPRLAAGAVMPPHPMPAGVAWPGAPGTPPPGAPPPSTGLLTGLAGGPMVAPHGGVPVLVTPQQLQQHPQHGTLHQQAVRQQKQQAAAAQAAAAAQKAVQQQQAAAAQAAAAAQKAAQQQRA